MRLSETFEDGDALYRAASEQGLEGISRNVASRYQPGKRTGDWIKVKVRDDRSS